MKPDIKYKSAIRKVCRLLQQEWDRREPPKPGDKRKVAIYAWDESVAGLRVAELSFSVRHGDKSVKISGSSYMQSDERSAPPLFFAERLILEITHFGDIFSEDIQLYTENLMAAAFD